MKQGVPYEVAMNLEQDIAFAYFVALGEIEGGDWNWDAGQWNRRD